MKAILVVHFGVTHEDTKKKTIDVINQLVEDLNYAPMEVAYTSEMIRKVLKKRGQDHLNVPLALEKLASEGVEEVYLLPTHLLWGHEYHKLMAQCREKAHLFKLIEIAPPLLSDVEDYKEVAKALSARYPLQEDEALVLVGHGTDHPINCAYPALAYEFHRRDENVFVATVEGYPTLEDVLHDLKKKEYHKLHLAPLLFVAGEHAKKDMAHGEGSFYEVLTQEGYTVETHLVGIGEIEGIQQLYVEHLKAIWNNS